MPSIHFTRPPLTILLATLLVLASACGSARADGDNPSTFASLAKSDQVLVDDLEKRTFGFFRDSANQKNGLIPDHWPDDPTDKSSDYFSSIAAIGFGLTTYAIGVERGWMKRNEAVKRTLTTLRFLMALPEGTEADAASYRGFFYHFLDMDTGRRYHSATWVELSTIDTTLLMSGVLFCESYYDRNNKDEKEIRKLAGDLYARVDWTWASPRPPLVSMGWTPEAGFIHADWQGYDEAMILYILALGSPTHPLDASSWNAWTQTNDRTWGSFQGQEHLGFAPLFGHQYSHVWIDFRGIQDDYIRGHGIDYFINSLRATLAQREYAIHNPLQWKDYGQDIWGLTASNGPRAPTKRGEVDRYAADPKTFYGYVARGAGLIGTIDDGTIAPTAAASSIAFAPNIAVPAIREMKQRYGDHVYTKYGFIDAFNPSFTFEDRKLRSGEIVPGVGWVDALYLGIDQGPIVTMIENYRSDFVWSVMRKNPHIRLGLERAGFKGGWLEAKPGARSGGKKGGAH